MTWFGFAEVETQLFSESHNNFSYIISTYLPNYNASLTALNFHFDQCPSILKGEQLSYEARYLTVILVQVHKSNIQSFNFTDLQAL